MGNALSKFWNSLFGGNSLGQTSQNAANSFIANASNGNNTQSTPKPMGMNLNPSTIAISQGDVSTLGTNLYNTIKKYGTSYLANSGNGQNPILGAGITIGQNLFGGSNNNQQPTNAQAGVQNTSLAGTMQDTLGNNTSNYQSVYNPLTVDTGGSQQQTSNTTTPTNSISINDLPNGQLNSYSTPEGQSYLNSLNGYQNQIMKFYSEADEMHNHELSQINAQMQNIKNQQEQENIYQAEAARQSGISTGLAFFTPQLYQSAIKNTIDVGLQKIADITVKQNGLILDADKASIKEKRDILQQLQQLQTEKFNATRTMKEDFMKQKQFEDAQTEKVIANNLPAIYDQVQKLPAAEQGAFLSQAAQRLGVPISQMVSSYRNFNQKENAAVSSVYQSIAEKLASSNPALAVEIAQKSLTPEGRKELMNSPYFKAAAAMGNLANSFGPTDASSVVDIMAQLESSGGKNIKNPDKNGIDSVFQYQKDVWADYSRLWNKAVNGIDAPIPEKDILKYERAVTGFIVNQWMEGEGLTGEEVAARWNGAHIVNGRYVANNPDHIRRYRELAGGSSTGGSIPNLGSIANSLATNLYGTDQKKASAFAQSLIASSTPQQIIDGAISDELIKRKSATNFSDIDSALSNISNLNSLLSEYYANGGQTGWLSGSYQNFINKVGKTNNPALIGVATSIKQSIQAYRKAISGVAFGEKENEDIKAIFPGIEKSKNLNDAVLNSRINDLKKQKISLASQVIGSTLANQLYGSTSSNAGNGSNTFTSNSGKKYNLPY